MIRLHVLLIGVVEWAEETCGVGRCMVGTCNSFNILLGFKPLWPMVTGDTRGTTTGCLPRSNH